MSARSARKRSVFDNDLLRESGPVDITATEDQHHPLTGQFLTGRSMVFAGGIIPDADVEPLKKLGIAEVFPPGSSLEEIISFVQSHTRK